MPFLTNALRQARLACLTTAWVAAVLAILTARPDGTVASLGACAFGLFILLTVARLRWDSMVILAVLALVTWLLLDELPDVGALVAGGRRVLIFAALLPTMALVRATAMTMPSVHATQLRLGALPSRAFIGGQQLAAHVFGGIINTGAFALMSAALPDDGAGPSKR